METNWKNIIGSKTHTEKTENRTQNLRSGVRQHYPENEPKNELYKTKAK